MSDTQKVIESEVRDVLAAEKSLQDLEAQLMQNEQFRQFLKLSKSLPKQLEETWQRIQEQMEANNIKSIKGSWGSITLAERLTFNIDMSELPPEFTRQSPDLKKIADTYRLEGEAPKGAIPKVSRYLNKRLK